MSATTASQTQPASVLGENSPGVTLRTSIGKKDKSAAMERRPVLVIGSRRDCELSVEHPSVSKIHCAIVNTGAAVFACDLKSRGGTQLNGEPIRVARLSDGDCLRVGEQDVTLSITGDSAHVDENTFTVEQPIILQGEADDESYELTQIVSLIGRRSSCDVALDDPDASLVHALLFHLEGHPAICDLGSRGGTRINDKATTLSWLNDGDELGIGDGRFQIGWSGESRTDPLSETPGPPSRKRAAAVESAADAPPGADAIVAGGIPELEATLATLHEAISTSRQEMDRQALDLQEVEKELCARKAELDQRETTLTQRDAEAAARLEELAAEKSRVDELQSDLAKRQRDFDERAVELEAAAQTRDEMIKRFAREQSGLEATRAELEARRGELDAAQAELEKSRDELSTLRTEVDAARDELKAEQAELESSRRRWEESQAERDASQSELEAAQAELDATRSALEAERTAVDADTARLTEERTKMEAELVTIEEYRAEIESDHEKLQQSRGEAEAAQSELAESRAKLAQQQADVERRAAEQEKSAAKLAARLEALERREEALEDREIELDERTEDLNRASEQRKQLDVQIADAKSAIESVAQMFTTDEFRAKTNAHAQPVAQRTDSPSAELTETAAAEPKAPSPQPAAANKPQGPPPEFERLSDDLKERFRILRRLSRKSDSEIIRQILGDDSPPSADADAPSATKPPSKPGPRPRDKGESKAKKTKKGWFS